MTKLTLNWKYYTFLLKQKDGNAWFKEKSNKFIKIINETK